MVGMHEGVLRMRTAQRKPEELHWQALSPEMVGGTLRKTAPGADVDEGVKPDVALRLEEPEVEAMPRLEPGLSAAGLPHAA